MKISEIIKKLQDYQTQLGDLDFVTVIPAEEGMYVVHDWSFVRFEAPDGRKYIALLDEEEFQEVAPPDTELKLIKSPEQPRLRLIKSGADPDDDYVCAACKIHCDRVPVGAAMFGPTKFCQCSWCHETDWCLSNHAWRSYRESES